MPYAVKKSGKGWVIYNKDTNKIVGHSDSKAKAQASANARNASHHGWKPTGKKARSKKAKKG